MYSYRHTPSLPAALPHYAAYTAALSAGGDLSAGRLVNLDGGEAQASVALDLVAALASLPPATGELQATALAIAAADRYAARLDGRCGCQHFGPYLAARTLPLLPHNAAAALLLRASNPRLADGFQPVAPHNRPAHQGPAAT